MLFKRFGEKLRSLFGGRKIDDAFFDELEDTLIEGDLGARLTDEIITELREISRREKITEAEDLRARMKEILSGYIKSYEAMPEHGKVNVYMILGVNGVGKTTTIAKMAKRFSGEGYKVLLAAGDTFRAAAVDQLDIHATRLGMRIVKQQMGSDPGAVYRKFIVIDATTGQNGVSQAMLFNEAVKLDGVILTKYDSAAKGGSLLQIGRLLGLPVLFVCTGEGYDDIKPFDKDEFLSALMGIE